MATEIASPTFVHAWKTCPSSLKIFLNVYFWGDNVYFWGDNVYFWGDNVYFWEDNVYFWGTNVYFWVFSKILGFGNSVFVAGGGGGGLGLCGLGGARRGLRKYLKLYVKIICEPSSYLLRDTSGAQTTKALSTQPTMEGLAGDVVAREGLMRGMEVAFNFKCGLRELGSYTLRHPETPTMKGARP